MKIKSRKFQGFTLIEILIVLVISSIVLLGAYTFFSQQQKTFRQQTEQARQQSNVRMALYYISQDLLNAGFTGTLFGIEGAINTALKNGISTIPIRVVSLLSPSTEFNQLFNRQGKELEILEIWANFSAQTTTITNSVNPGANTIYVQDASVFQVSIWDESLNQMVTVHPLGFIISSPTLGTSEYHPLSMVNISTNYITSSEMVISSYNPGDLIAPVWRRVYFVQEDSQQNRSLVRRDYYLETTMDTVLAEDIVDFQVFFDLQDPITRVMTIEADPDAVAIDPCQIRAVKIIITGLVQTPDMNRPKFLTVSKRVSIRNLWLDPTFNHQCSSMTIP